MSQRHVFQAIETRFMPATDYRASRVKASCNAGSVTLEWDYALSVFDNHRAAAEALVLKMGWGAYLFAGGYSDGGYVFVQVTDIDLFTMSRELHNAPVAAS